MLSVFAFSDGYIVAEAMMSGPKSVRRPALQETTGAVMVATIAVAIAVGSVLSNVVVKML